MAAKSARDYSALLQEYLDELEEFSDLCTAGLQSAPAEGCSGTIAVAQTGLCPRPMGPIPRKVRGILVLNQPHKSRLIPQFIPNRHQG